MAKEVSFIRRVARMGDMLIVTIPSEHHDLFKNRRVRVTRLED